MPTDPALLVPRVRLQVVPFVSLSTASCLVVDDGTAVVVAGTDVAGGSVDGRSAEQGHFLLLLRCIRSWLMKPAAVGPAAGLAV